MRRSRLATQAVLLAAVALPALTACSTTREAAEVIVQPAPAAVNALIAGWPATPRDVANTMMDKYGQPDEVTPTQLIWHDTGEWKMTIVNREEIPHNFPKPHTDLLEQVIDYRVPPDKFDELAAYDGSVIVERTMGTMSARCDKEEMNFLALNLANDVVTGAKTVEEARRFYAETVQAFMRGERPAYTQGLQFQVPTGGTADPDVRIVPGS